MSFEKTRCEKMSVFVSSRLVSSVICIAIVYLAGLSSSLFLFDLFDFWLCFSRSPFVSLLHHALSCVNGLSASVDVMVYPIFVLVLTGSKRQDETRQRRNTFCSWPVERQVLKVSLIFKNIARLKEYYSFWVINSLLITEYISLEDHKIPLKPN